MFVYKQILDKKGWAKISNINWNADSLLKLAYDLGTPVPSRIKGPLIDELRPISKDMAKPRSLSSIHGKGEFPLHSDTAYWRIPARYLILHAKNVEQGCHPTLILDTNILTIDVETNDMITRGVFKVINGRNSFLSVIKEKDRTIGIDRFRFDTGCMKPANNTAVKAFNKFSSLICAAKVDTINWSTGDVLIIDNWRCLHGRGAPLITFSGDRILERILVI